MSTLLGVENKKLFPCPLCGEGLEVSQSKKGKPYVVCNGCGVQMFVRNEGGIRTFEKLVAQAETKNIWERLAGLEERYKRQCTKCGKKFWIADELVETSWFDGKFIGYRCPEEGCGGGAKPEERA